MYTQAFNEDIAENEINIQLWTGIVAFLGWIRIIMSLTVTQTLGPIINMITFMFKDIAVFLIIWSMILIAFSMVAVLGF